jgi:hypothetical protein
MDSESAIALITEIKKTPYAVRMMKLSTREWDFINSINHLAKLGKSLSDKQGWRLQELYRISQGSLSKVWREVIK